MCETVIYLSLSPFDCNFSLKIKYMCDVIYFTWNLGSMQSFVNFSCSVLYTVHIDSNAAQCAHLFQSDVLGLK